MAPPSSRTAAEPDGELARRSGRGSASPSSPGSRRGRDRADEDEDERQDVVDAAAERADQEGEPEQGDDLEGHVDR